MELVKGDSKSKVFFKSSECLDEIQDESIQLVVTSPPYYTGKNYGSSDHNLENQDSFEEYKKSLKEVLEECFRVLKPDGKLCLNLIDPYATKDEYGRFKKLTLTQELILFLEELGLDYMETIRWINKRYGNSGAVLGSYPHPTNFYFNGTYENIFVFRKWVSEDYYDTRELPEMEVREKSKLTKEEWREWTNPTWEIDSKENKDHPVEYPYDLPYRCIRLFSFKGDTILDPFCGTGTSIKAAVENDRNAIGYEVEEQYKEIIKEKILDD